MHTPEEIAEQQFLISLRGYDRDEVSAFLDEVADQVGTLQRRIAELEAERDQQPEPAAAAEPQDAGRRASFRELGEETTRVLEAAEDAAEQMRTRASEEARTLVEEARRDAAQQREEAEEHARTLVEEAQNDAQEERSRANETATQVLEEARRSARETLDTAQAQHREIAETVRELEQLRARLVDDLRAVGGTIDDAVGRLGPDATDGTDVSPPEDISLEELTEDVQAPGPGPAVPQDERPTAEAGAGEPAADVDADVADVDADEAGAEDADVEDVADEDVTPSPAVADVASRELRDQALAGIRPGMLRRLKRTLQDVQNGVLDAIRREGRETDVVNLIPAGDELAPLHSVGEAFLGEAYRAGLGDGATLAAVPPDGQAEDPERVAAAADDFRNTVGHEVVSALEPTLAAGIEAGEEAGALGERVSEIFRDLKGPVAESAADQSLLRIHSLGVHDAWVQAGVGERVWVVGDEARCPENRCRANADEGPVGFEDPFPSGDTVPPAHPGCTCTLAPA